MLRFTLHSWPGEIDYEGVFVATNGDSDEPRTLVIGITSRIRSARIFGRTNPHDFWFYPMPPGE